VANKPSKHQEPGKKAVRKDGMINCTQYDTLKPYAPLALRLLLALVFLYHGAQKFGYFEGPGLENFGNFVGAMGLPIPKQILAMAGAGGEVAGAVLLLFGLFTRFGAFLIMCTMIFAIAMVHWKEGLFNADGGFEYPLTLLVCASSLLFSGSGALALDNLIQLKCKSPK
jgi:putative oxidoreductase